MAKMAASPPRSRPPSTSSGIAAGLAVGFMTAFGPIYLPLVFIASFAANVVDYHTPVSVANALFCMDWSILYCLGAMVLRRILGPAMTVASLRHVFWLIVTSL